MSGLPTNMVTMAEPFLELSMISQEFLEEGRNNQAIQDLSLSISEGEFVSIVGPSGCGKSTLLRILQGLIRPTRGEVLYRGRPCEGVNGDMGMVFQGFALFPWMTVRENVGIDRDLFHNMGWPS